MATMVVAALCCGSANIFAQMSDSIPARRWYVPDFLPIQYAGNIGFLSAGIGYSTRVRNYHASLMYGYVPKSVAQTYIHTIALKNTFPITRYALKNNQVLVPYIGAGVSFELSGNAFFRQPDHFPESYYDFPKNIHALLYGGAKVQHLFEDTVMGMHGVEFFLEAGTIDVYLWYKSMSRDIKLNEIFTLAFGVNLLIDR